MCFTVVNVVVVAPPFFCPGRRKNYVVTGKETVTVS